MSPNATPASSNCRSYVLRLWPVDSAEGPDWQGSLVSIADGKYLRFAELDQLLTYLRTTTTTVEQMQQNIMQEVGVGLR